MTAVATKPVNCSFCGKTQEQVRKLIAAPRVYICNECVALCNEILEEECPHPIPLEGRSWPAVVTWPHPAMSPNLTF